MLAATSHQNATWPRSSSRGSSSTVSSCAASSSGSRHRTLPACSHLSWRRPATRRQPAPAGAAAASPRPASPEPQQAPEQQQQQQLLAAAAALVRERGLDADVGLVASEAVLALQLLRSQPGACPASVREPADLVARALQLSDLLATGSTFRTLAMLKRHPALLGLSPHVVTERVLRLKLLMPACNVAELIYQKPSLLLMDDLAGRVGGALAQLHALMPGIPVEAKLHEGGTVFWSFASLLSSRADAASTASIDGGAGG